MFFAHLLIGEARSLVQVGGPQEDTARAMALRRRHGLRAHSPLRCARIPGGLPAHQFVSTRRRTICGFRPGWCIAGARSRRRTGRSRPIRSRGWSTTVKDFGRDLMILNKRTGLLGAVAALAWLAGCGGGGSSSGGHSIQRRQRLCGHTRSQRDRLLPRKHRLRQSERLCWVRLSAEGLLRSRLRSILPANLSIPPTRAEATFRCSPSTATRESLPKSCRAPLQGLNPTALVDGFGR